MMMETICEKCGQQVPSGADARFSHCPYCGAPLAAKATTASGTRRSNLGVGTIVLTSVLTTVIAVTILGAFGLGIYFFTRNNSVGSVTERPGDSEPGEPAEHPRRGKQPSSIPATDIVRVVWTRWRHEGPVSGGGRVVSTSLAFARDLSAMKTENVNYDADDSRDSSTQSVGKIDQRHFDKLAANVTDFDFLNEPDGKDRIIESEHSLTIVYSSGEKKIRLNNTGTKNTAEVESILNTLTGLNELVTWSASK